MTALPEGVKLTFPPSQSCPSRDSASSVEIVRDMLRAPLQAMTAAIFSRRNA